MGVYLDKTERPSDIPDALIKLIGTDKFEVFRFMDDEVYDDEAKGYGVYKLVNDDNSFVLKKSEDDEYFRDEVKHYSLLKGLPVPKLLGAAKGFLLLEHIDGEDLKKPTDDGIRAFAKSLASIMNAYPMGRDYERGRYETYLKRLEKRAAVIKDEPELKAAFSVFFERQREIPLTLSNSDLLPINVLFDGEKATIIDWEFGGFMPYALDIARFFAHGRVSGKASPFRMTDEQKRMFVDLMYEWLEVKPERAVFDRDILLAEFNEHVEILEYYFREQTAERGETFRDYYPRAKELAKRIIASESKTQK